MLSGDTSATAGSPNRSVELSTTCPQRIQSIAVAGTSSARMAHKLPNHFPGKSALLP